MIVTVMDAKWQKLHEITCKIPIFINYSMELPLVQYGTRKTCTWHQTIEIVVFGDSQKKAMKVIITVEYCMYCACISALFCYVGMW